MGKFLSTRVKAALPPICGPETSLGDVLRLLVDTQGPCVYVVNSHKRPVTMITLKDVLQAVDAHVQHLECDADDPGGDEPVASTQS